MIVFDVIQALVDVPLAAEMHHGEFFQELRQGGAYGFVHGAGAEASSDDHEHRAVFGDPGQLIAPFPRTGQQFRADRGAGHQRLVRREILDGLREIAADGLRSPVGELVGQAGRHVGLVDHHRDVPHAGGPDHGHGNIAALGEDDVRLEFFDDLRRLAEAHQDPEGVGEVLHVKVSAQLSGGNAAVFDPLALDQTLFDTFVGTDIEDLKPCFLKTGKEGDVRCDVAGSTAAGKDDFRHGITSTAAVLCYIMSVGAVAPT